ncbi:MAG: MFS transporter, partial [bacterium]
LPVLRKVFGLSDIEAGYLITLYTLPAIFLAPPVGMMADRLGRKHILVPSLFLFGGAGFSICFVNSYTAIMLLRFVQGVGSTSLALISRTLVGDLFKGPEQNAVMGLNDATLALGAAAYPFLGGYLAQIHWYYPFLLYAFPCLVSPASLLFLRTVPLKPATDTIHYIQDGLKVLMTKRVLLLFAATFASFVLLYGSIQTILPLYLSESFGFQSDSIGTFISTMAVTIAVVSFFNGRLATLFSSRTLIIVGFGCYGIGLILLGLGTGVIVFVLGLGIFGIGHGLTLPSMNTALVTSVEAKSRGALMSLRTIFSRSGQTAGPFLFPLLGLSLTHSFLLSVSGVLTLLLTSIAAVLWTDIFSQPEEPN